MLLPVVARRVKKSTQKRREDDAPLSPLRVGGQARERWRRGLELIWPDLAHTHTRDQREGVFGAEDAE